MNFLQLCQRLRSEADISGTGPSSVVGQSGEMLDIVNWILQAYEEVQNLHSDWKFLQDTFNFSTIVGNAEYTPASVSLSSLNRWKRDDLRIYLAASDETYLSYVHWDEFRATYQFGSSRAQAGRPSVVSVKPDSSLILWPKPDQVYTIDGQYFKKAQTMASNADVPLIPSNYHMVIVWQALLYYGAKLGAADVYSHAEKQFKKALRKLEINQLPSPTWGAPLT